VCTTTLDSSSIFLFLSFSPASGSASWEFTLRWHLSGSDGIRLYRGATGKTWSQSAGRAQCGVDGAGLPAQLQTWTVSFFLALGHSE
jgi:hypothetical protein